VLAQEGRKRSRPSDCREGGKKKEGSDRRGGGRGKGEGERRGIVGLVKKLVAVPKEGKAARPARKERREDASDAGEREPAARGKTRPRQQGKRGKAECSSGEATSKLAGRKEKESRYQISKTALISACKGGGKVGGQGALMKGRSFTSSLELAGGGGERKVTST